MVQARCAACCPTRRCWTFAATKLRTLSLRIFDRSFAVTYYLQAVAIAIGLVASAASLSAQVLARRKEFGLLAHLGLTRRQVLGRGGRRRRRLAGRRHADRPGAGAGGQRWCWCTWSTRRASTGRWTCRCPPGRLAALCSGGAGDRHRHRASRRGGAVALGRAGGEGGLVNPQPPLPAGRCRRHWRRRRRPQQRPASPPTPCAAAAPLLPARPWRAPGARTEWWYATGWLGTPGRPAMASRSRSSAAAPAWRSRPAGRLAPRQLLFAHAAVTDLAAAATGTMPAHRALERRRGRGPKQAASARPRDTQVWIGPGAAARRRRPYRARSQPPATRRPVAGPGLRPRSRCCCRATPASRARGPTRTPGQPLLQPAAAGRAGTARLDGRRQARRGRAWLDHEWSDEILAPTPWAGTGSASTWLRRQRAHRLSPAPARRLGAVGRRQPPRPPATARAASARRGALDPGRRWRSPGTGAATRWTGRWTPRPAASACARCSTRRSSTAATGQHRHRVLGRPERTAGRRGRRIGLGYLE
jgi:hypothetical protein